MFWFGFRVFFISLIQSTRADGKQLDLGRNGDLPANRRYAIKSKLPDTANILENEFKKESFNPINPDHLRDNICQTMSIQAGKSCGILRCRLTVSRLFRWIFRWARWTVTWTDYSTVFNFIEVENGYCGCHWKTEWSRSWPSGMTSGSWSCLIWC